MPQQGGRQASSHPTKCTCMHPLITSLSIWIRNNYVATCSALDWMLAISSVFVLFVTCFCWINFITCVHVFLYVYCSCFFISVIYLHAFGAFLFKFSSSDYFIKNKFRVEYPDTYMWCITYTWQWIHYQP